MSHRLPFVLLLLVPVVCSAAEPKGDSVSLDFGQSDQSAAESAIRVGPKQVEVVATGVGTEPEKALQNAYAHAVEQAVGVMVDAETRVENDAIVSDKILTYSDGFVEGYDVVRRWEESGLHCVRIRARVKTKKLVEKLKAEKIAVCEVFGDRWYLQAIHEWDSERNAVEMLRKAMADCTMDRLLKVEIEGEPKIAERNPIHVKLRVKVKLTADMEAWEKFRVRLKPLLGMVAKENKRTMESLRQTVNADGTVWFQVSNEDMQKNRQMWNVDRTVVCLLLACTDPPTKTFWDVLAVPNAVLDEPMAEMKLRRYRLRIEALDQQGNAVARTDHPLGQFFSGVEGRGPKLMSEEYSGCHSYYLAPFFWGYTSALFVQLSRTVEETVTIPIDELQKVKGCRALIEEVRTK